LHVHAEVAQRDGLFTGALIRVRAAAREGRVSELRVEAQLDCLFCCIAGVRRGIPHRASVRAARGAGVRWFLLAAVGCRIGGRLAGIARSRRRCVIVAACDQGEGHN
jgi:hypothetical protein